MALRDFSSRLSTLVFNDARPLIRPSCASSSALLQKRRNASSTSSNSAPAASAAADIEDLEPSSSLTTPAASEEIIKSFDPVAVSRQRKRQLPASRYNYRSPKYYRGPLHPHQPPPASSPDSRLFTPGPFTLPRLQQTYTSTFAPDILTLTYAHRPPGFSPPPKGERLRSWDGSSPYHKNRPARGPRGGDVLRLLTRPATFRNVPKLTGVTVHTMVAGALEDSAYLHVAGMVVQAITNARVQTHKSKGNVNQWGLREGKHVAVTAELKGEDMYHFVAKVVDVVLPRIKDWRGVKGSSGDSSGNLSFGLTADAMSLFPEIEVNYDMYPPKMIPGCHVTIHTSATNDRDARLLLTSIGIPFYGKQIN
ncbi:MAG: hypothetical protein M1819_007126 [Sarea resinae]|nr:MAG: hypothetical protein M1819_007126 [Sarea resinae]